MTETIKSLCLHDSASPQRLRPHRIIPKGVGHPSLVHDHYVARSFGSFRPTHSEQFLWTCHAVSSVFFCLLVCFLFFAQLMGYPSCADLFFIKMFKSDLFNGCTRQTTSCVMGRNCSSVRTASDRHAADESSISRCGKGFFSHCHLSVQTLLRVFVYSRVQSHAVTSVRTLKIPRIEEWIALLLRLL